MNFLRKEIFIMSLLIINQSIKQEQGEFSKAINDSNRIITFGMKNESVMKNLSIPELFLVKNASSIGRIAVWGYSKYEQGKLGLFIFEDSALVKYIPGKIPEYDWNPQGDCLVYLEEGKNKDYMFIGGSLSIYHANTQSIEKIIENTDLYLMDVSWAKFDGNIYIEVASEKGWGVYRIDLENKKLILTNYHGNIFSPDGIFYFKKGREGSNGILYERETNRVVWDSWYTDYPQMSQFREWRKNKRGETILYLMDGYFNIGILNCETVEFKFFKRPQKGMSPVFDFENENVIWK